MPTIDAQSPDSTLERCMMAAYYLIDVAKRADSALTTIEPEDSGYRVVVEPAEPFGAGIEAPRDTDAQKLAFLAEWMDREQDRGRWPGASHEVQEDLRRMAKVVDAAGSGDFICGIQAARLALKVNDKGECQSAIVAIERMLGALGVEPATPYELPKEGTKHADH